MKLMEISAIRVLVDQIYRESAGNLRTHALRKGIRSEDADDVLHKTLDAVTCYEPRGQIAYAIANSDLNDDETRSTLKDSLDGILFSRHDLECRVQLKAYRSSKTVPLTKADGKPAPLDSTADLARVIIDWIADAHRAGIEWAGHEIDTWCSTPPETRPPANEEVVKFIRFIAYQADCDADETQFLVARGQRPMAYDKDLISKWSPTKTHRAKRSARRKLRALLEGRFCKVGSKVSFR